MKCWIAGIAAAWPRCGHARLDRAASAASGACALSSLAARERGRGRRTAGAGGHGRDAQALRCLPDAGRAGHAGLDPHRLAAGAAVPGHAHPGAGRRHEGVGHRGPADAGRGRFHFRTRLPGRVARALAPSAAVGCVGLAAASLEEPALRYGAQGQAVLAPVGLPPHRPGAMPAPGRGRESGPEAGGSPPAATRPRVASALFDQAMASLRLLPRWQDGGEPFARAKARVVGEFEREYLRRAPPITAATWRRPPGRPASTAAHSGR